MDCFAKELTPEHIPEGLWREVAETIGAENLYKLAELIGGATLYIPKPESLTRPIRDAHIKAEFNGWNHLELAKKYNVTDRLVRQVCGPGCTEGQLNQMCIRDRACARAARSSSAWGSWWAGRAMARPTPSSSMPASPGWPMWSCLLYTSRCV